MKQKLIADFDALMARLTGSKPLTEHQLQIFRLVWLSGALGLMKNVGEATAVARTATTSPTRELCNLGDAFLENSKAVRDLFIEHDITVQVAALITRAKTG